MVRHVLIISSLLLSGCGFDGPAKWLVPEKAVDWAVAHKLQEKRVFNEYNFGGYLIHRGIKTFIDGRTIPFGDLARRIHDERWNLGPMLDQYRVEWAIMHSRAPNWFAAMPDKWQEVYRDEVAVIYVKKGE